MDPKEYSKLLIELTKLLGKDNKSLAELRQQQYIQSLSYKKNISAINFLSIIDRVILNSKLKSKKRNYHQLKSDEDEDYINLLEGIVIYNIIPDDY